MSRNIKSTISSNISSTPIQYTSSSAKYGGIYRRIPSFLTESANSSMNDSDRILALSHRYSAIEQLESLENAERQRRAADVQGEALKKFLAADVSRLFLAGSKPLRKTVGFSIGKRTTQLEFLGAALGGQERKAAWTSFILMEEEERARRLIDQHENLKRVLAGKTSAIFMTGYPLVSLRSFEEEYILEEASTGIAQSLENGIESIVDTAKSFGNLAVRAASFFGAKALEGAQNLAIKAAITAPIVADKAQAAGEIALEQAQILGGKALEGAAIAGELALEGAQAAGTKAFQGAAIAGELALEGAQAAGTKAIQGAAIAGELALEGAQAAGTKAIQGAAIAGELAKEGAQYAGAKAMEGAQIAGVLAKEGAQIAKEGALIAGEKALEGAALATEGAQIAGAAAVEGAAFAQESAIIAGSKVIEGAHAVAILPGMALQGAKNLAAQAQDLATDIWNGYMYTLTWSDLANLEELEREWRMASLNSLDRFMVAMTVSALLKDHLRINDSAFYQPKRHYGTQVLEEFERIRRLLEFKTDKTARKNAFRSASLIKAHANRARNTQRYDNWTASQAGSQARPQAQISTAQASVQIQPAAQASAVVLQPVLTPVATATKTVTWGPATRSQWAFVPSAQAGFTNYGSYKPASTWKPTPAAQILQQSAQQQQFPVQQGFGVQQAFATKQIPQVQTTNTSFSAAM